jgi:hypothetical protein
MLIHVLMRDKPEVQDERRNNLRFSGIFKSSLEMV